MTETSDYRETVIHFWASLAAMRKKPEEKVISTQTQAKSLTKTSINPWSSKDQQIIAGR